MRVLPISKGVYASRVIFLLISKEGEDDITVNIARGGHPFFDIVPNNHGGEHDINPHIAGGIHPFLILFLISRGESMILLAISQGVYTTPVTLFLISSNEDIDIILKMEYALHPA